MNDAFSDTDCAGCDNEMVNMDVEEIVSGPVWYTVKTFLARLTTTTRHVGNDTRIREKENL